MKMSSEETKTAVPGTKYAILMETNGEECESWYYFIKYDGNEKELDHLKKQIDQIEMYVLDDLSAFDIETENLVSEQTASEMLRIEVNSVTFHRKFDGKMQFIDLKLKKKDSNERRIEKINDIIGMGDIENFVEGEDVPPEHLEDSDEEDSKVELDPTIVHKAIKNLPDGGRTILVLYALEGYKHREIADMMGISESTSRTQYRRALGLLNKSLKEKVYVN